MTDPIPMNKEKLLSWELTLVKLLLFALVAMVLQKPTGSLAGRIAMEQEGFNLYSYDIKSNRVYAIAVGPRGSEIHERGVWVRSDGSFRLDQLPIGEYSLKVHVPGFATSFENGIFVDEGKVTNLRHPIALHLIQPSVNIASNTRVFTSAETPRFWINATGANKAVVKIYKQNLLTLVASAPKDLHFDVSPDLSLYKPYDGKLRKVSYFNKLPYLRRWVRPLSSDVQDWSHEEFKCESPLPPGDYLACVEVSNIKGKKDWNVLWFSVSDLGLIVKQDAEKTLVRAIDLNTLRALPDVSVQLLDRTSGANCLAVGQAKTGSDGFTSIAWPHGLTSRSANFLVYGLKGVHHAYGGLSFYNGDYQRQETYFYTDRPVYRLGQTVFYKGIARTQTLAGLKNPGDNLKLTAHIEDPSNNKIWEGKLRTGKHGTFHGAFAIPVNGKTGAYQITINYPDGSTSYERFEVAEYRKPEYKVEVIPMESRVVAGSTIRARVRANYYFGAPVANAKVKYSVYAACDWGSRFRLMPRPDYYSYFDDWEPSERGYEADSGYAGDYIREGYAQTDDNGEAIIEFATKPARFDPKEQYLYDFWDRRYKIDVEVVDLSRIAVLGSSTVSVTNGDFALFMRPRTYVCKVGEPILADFSAVDYDGVPIRNVKVSCKLMRRKWDRNRDLDLGFDVYEEAVATTDENGKGQITFKTLSQFPTDTYYLRAQAKDSHQHVIFDEANIWIASENYPYVLGTGRAESEPLAIKLDKTVYKPGDIAKVMITAPVTGAEGAQAIVSIEGSKIYSYKVVDMRATASLVEIPLTSSYAPNVYVTATFVGKKHQFYQQSEIIRVSPRSNFLHITVSTDKSKYKPQDIATYTIKASFMDGKPAANTEISLAVVDESIFAIRPDQTPDICKFFFGKRPNWVMTLCSFPEEYSGGGNKIEPRVRKEFRDTAAWLPTLITNSVGIATAHIKLPDNLTSWRATAKAVNMETNVGSAIKTVISTQDLVLRLALPRFFCQGDEGFLTAVLHNFSDRTQQIDLKLAVSPHFQVTENLTQKVVVAPEKAKRFSWPTKIISSGEGVIQVKAIGETAGDAMELKLPIRPLGVHAFAVKTGMLDGQDEIIDLPLELPNGAIPGSANCKLYLSSSYIGSLLGNFNALIDYPYGCTEQTMSRLMPAVVAIRLHQSLGVPLKWEDIKKFKEVYKQGMTILREYQHEDGGWGWWSDDTSNAYLTALVLEGYKLLAEAGYTIDEKRAEKGKEWLAVAAKKLCKQLSDPLHVRQLSSDHDAIIDLSKMFYVLSLYGEKLPAPINNWVLRQTDHMTPEALAYFTLAFKNSHQTQAANLVYERLKELANNEGTNFGSFVNWEFNAKMSKRLKLLTSYYSYRFTSVETTALALKAVLAMEPNNTEFIEAIKRWILMQRGNDGWGNTKTTAQVLTSFMEEELQMRGSGQTNFQVAVSQSSQVDTIFGFADKSVYEAEKNLTIMVPDSKQSGYGKDKNHKVRIHKQGTGRLYYSLILTYYQTIKPGQYVSAKSLPEGLHVNQEFYRLVPLAPDSNGNMRFETKPLYNKTVRMGETVLMRTFVDSPVRIPYSVLEVPLPSGGEIVKDDPRKDLISRTINGVSNSSYCWLGDWWWTHQDILDDRLVYFVTNLPEGKVELGTMVRMELPGKFCMNPIALEGMYTKNVRAYSTPNVITVVEK